MSLPALSTTNDVCKRKKKILDIQRHMVQLSSENWFTAGNFQCQIRITQRMKTHKRKDLKRNLRLVCQMKEWTNFFFFYLTWGKLLALVSQGTESRWKTIQQGRLRTMSCGRGWYLGTAVCNSEQLFWNIVSWSLSIYVISQFPRYCLILGDPKFLFCWNKQTSKQTLLWSSNFIIPLLKLFLWISCAGESASFWQILMVIGRVLVTES